VLATTDRYLLLIPTKLDGDAKAKNGFTKSMNCKATPAPPPIKLSLDPKNILEMGFRPSEVKFTQAHFNRGDANTHEKYIVSSVGKFVVIWSIKQVLKKKKFAYKIKCMSSEVVADNFRFNAENNIVVVEPNALFVASRN
jgi:hypothetical protein